MTAGMKHTCMQNLPILGGQGMLAPYKIWHSDIDFESILNDF